jgi:hypothetical protein
MMATNLEVKNKDEYYRKKITNGKRLWAEKGHHERRTERIGKRRGDKEAIGERGL